MTSSLVGSEMCIRDSYPTVDGVACISTNQWGKGRMASSSFAEEVMWIPCLLYTSDAADDM
eukprot:7038143-Prorocentrum_lima.AAC.1